MRFCPPDLAKKQRCDRKLRLEPPRAGETQTRLPAVDYDRKAAPPDPFGFMKSALSLPILHKTMPEAVYVPRFDSRLDFEGSTMGFEPERYGRAL